MKPDAIIKANVRDLLRELGRFYQRSLLISRSFGGPSEYFHAKAVQAARSEFLSNRHLEYVYATLACWGMHRMGDTKCKMVDFASFVQSVEACRDQLTMMRGRHLVSSDPQTLNRLLEGPIKTSFETLTVSVSEAKLVGNSKALHHIVPELIPVVDRQHTLRFFYRHQKDFKRIDPRGKITWGTVPFPKSVDEQYAVFRQMSVEARKILRTKRVRALRALDEPNAPFNTSLPKVADNLVIAFVKEMGDNWEPT